MGTPSAPIFRLSNSVGPRTWRLKLHSPIPHLFLLSRSVSLPDVFLIGLLLIAAANVTMWKNRPETVTAGCVKSEVP
jgi:hypothetical protein